MTFARFLLTGLVVSVLVAAPAAAQNTPPAVVSYQGLLTDLAGNRIDDIVEIDFTIYDSEVAGLQLWTETHTDVDVVDGIYEVMLGTITEFSPDILRNDNTIYIELTVDGDSLSPRQQITSVYWAMVAGDVVGDIHPTSVTVPGWGAVIDYYGNWLGVPQPGGYPGPTGPTGPAGATGPMGPSGLMGPTGVMGPQGALGLTGPPGPTGPVGATGPQGVMGVTGPQGPAGATGPQGIQGIPGATGPQGPVGPAGATGPQGNQGIPGATGPLGPSGPQGIQGVPGPAGPTGNTGPQGPIGLTGPPGAQGPSGPLGPQGNPGNVGPSGPQGPQGVPGNVGPSGPQGPQGNPGNQGPSGPQGPQGNVGPSGPQGNPGNQGPSGPQGPQGNPGNQGPSGPQGPTGNQGPSGPQGNVGPSGPQGPTGAGATWDALEFRYWGYNYPPQADPFPVGCPMGPPFGEVEVCWGSLAWSGYYGPSYGMTYGGCCGHATFTYDYRSASAPAEQGGLGFIGVCATGDGGGVVGRKTNLYYNPSPTWTVGNRDVGILRGAISGPNYNTGQLYLEPAKEFVYNPFGPPYYTVGTWVKWQCHDINHNETPFVVNPFGYSGG